MSAPNFSCGQGDSGITWSEPVFDDDGNPIDVTVAGTTVAVHYQIDDLSHPPVDRVGIPVGTTPPGRAGLVIGSGDTAIPGRFLTQFLISQSGKRYTCPSRGHFVFEVVPAA